MPAGSWRVNFPDPTITGVDDESSRYIQIHFLSSMRLALTSMRYFDWMKGSSDSDPVSHDAIVDRYIDEVQSILSDWDTVCLHPPTSYDRIGILKLILNRRAFFGRQQILSNRGSASMYYLAATRC